MKFTKGMNESLLWDYLSYNIYDSLNEDKKLVDYTSTRNTLLGKILSKSGKLTKDIEIIVKINGKKVPDCWMTESKEKKKEKMKYIKEKKNKVKNILIDKSLRHIK